MAEAARTLQAVPDAARPGGVYRKIAAIMAKLDRIPKSGTNKHFGYKFVTEADVKGALRPLMAEAGLVCLPTVEEHVQEGEITRLKLILRFVDTDTGECVESTIYGEGQDTQDKGPAKALALGLKYGLLATFLIDTGDDPDDSDTPHPAQRRTAPAQTGTRRVERQSSRAASADPETGEVSSSDPYPAPAPSAPTPAANPPATTTPTSFKRPPAPAATAAPGGAARPAGPTAAQRNKLYAVARTIGLDPDDAKLVMQRLYGAATTDDLSTRDASDLIDRLVAVEKGKSTLADLLPAPPADDDPTAEVEAAVRAACAAQHLSPEQTGRYVDRALQGQRDYEDVMAELAEAPPF